MHQILDPRRRDRVERRSRLVHQDHVRLDGETASDAEPLLLAAREAERTFLQPILDLVPERGLLKCAFDAAAHVVSHPEDARAEGDVVVDRLRERVRLLEDHPDPTADLDGIDPLAVEVRPVIQNLAAHLCGGNEIVHSVETADQRALATAGWSDERRDRILEDIERDVLDRHVRSVGNGEIPDLKYRLARDEVALARRLDLDLRLHGAHTASLPTSRWNRGCRPVKIR